MNKRKLIISAIVIAITSSVTWNIYTDYRHDKLVEETYNNALNYISEENYAAAVNAFHSLQSQGEYDYREQQELCIFCRAQLSYASGDIEAAHKYLKSITSPSQQMNDLLPEYEDFKSQVDEEYSIHMAEKEKEEKRAYENRIKNGVPYVGMPESRISDTSLGAPGSDIRHNYECINGKQYRANLYDFKVNGHVVFTARCVQGEVIQVWDRRDSVDTSKPVKNGGYTSSKKHHSHEKKSDPYNVYDYSDPEDFYEDNYDDFWDFEDAEDYYNEHH